MGDYNALERYNKRRESNEISYNALERYKSNEANRLSAEMFERYKSLIEGSNNLLSDYKSRFYDKDGNFVTSYRKDTGEALKKYTSTKEKYDSETTKLRNFFNTYGKYLDSQTVSDITSSLDSGSKILNDIFNTYQSDYDYFSKYKDEDDYNQKVVIPKKQNEEWAAADTEALKTEIDNLESNYNSYIGLKTERDNLYGTIVSGYMRARYTKDAAEKAALNDSRIVKYDKELSQYGDMSGSAKTLSDKKQFLNNATRVQEGIALHDNAKNSEDFDKYSKTGGDISNPTFEDVKSHFWLPSGVKKVNNKVTYSREYYDGQN